MNKPEEHYWGVRPPEGARAWWGARAIFTPRNKSRPFDLLWDRSQIGSSDVTAEAVLRLALTSRVPATIRKMIRVAGLDPRDKDRISTTVLVGKTQIEIAITPARSFGYLYIGAWVR